jgi:hypothetical protein
MEAENVAPKKMRPGFVAKGAETLKMQLHAIAPSRNLACRRIASI